MAGFCRSGASREIMDVSGAPLNGTLSIKVAVATWLMCRRLRGSRRSYKQPIRQKPGLQGIEELADRRPEAGEIDQEGVVALW